MRTTPRHGIAIPMALLILVGLLLLGLPFLASQSASRAGAASMTARQAARLYADGTVNLGLALAMYTQTRHQAGAVAWTDLRTSITEGVLRSDGTEPLTDVPIAEAIAKNRLLIHATGLYAQDSGAMLANQPDQRVVTSLQIEDESGKLDGNSLGPLGWASVLDKAGIEDKDLGLRDGDIDLDHYFPVVAGVRSGAPANLSPAGQLADAIVLHRLIHGPFSSLRDLLLVNPQLPADPRFQDPKPGGKPLYRLGLTPAELSRLQPLVSMQVRGAGRQGYIDLANQAASDGRATQVYPDVDPLVDLLQNDLCIRTGAAWGVLHGTSLTQVGTDPIDLGEGLAFLLPAPLNFNQAPSAVLQTLTDFPAADTEGMHASRLADLGEVRLPWLSPFHGTWFHPPIAIASTGVVRLQAAAMLLDARDRPLAHETRAVVAQAVPRQGGQELRWTTQEDFQRTVDQHTSSRVASVPWPATTTAINSSASLRRTIPNSAPPAGPAWLTSPGLRPRTLPTLADLTNDERAGWMPGSDWQVLTERDSTKPALWLPGADLAPRLAEGILTQGANGIHLVFKNDGADRLMPFSGWDTEGRHVSFWVCATEDVTKDLRLLEVRHKDRSVDDRCLRLTWHPDRQVLVLRLSTAATSERVQARANPDDPTTPENEQAGGWTTTTSPSPSDPLIPGPNEWVLAKYLGPDAFTAGRWHHLQIVVGSGGPGSLALLVDGLVGRDLTRTLQVPNGTLAVGDYALLPTALLATTGTPSPTTPAAAAEVLLPAGTVTTIESTEGLLQPRSLATPRQIPFRVALSGFWEKLDPPLNLSPDLLFPTPGILRIGREYLHVDRMNSQGVVSRYWRGVRQDTVANPAHSSVEADPNRRYPLLDEHRTGALVLPGHFSLSSNESVSILRGRLLLRDPLDEVVRPWAPTQFRILGPQTLQTGASVSLDVTSGSPLPLDGVIRVNNSFFAYTLETPTSIIVREIGPGPVSVPALLSYPGELISLATTEAPDQLEPTDPATLGLTGTLPDPSNTTRFVQISDGQMRDVEWLACDATWRDPTTGTLYLINSWGAFRTGGSNRTPALPVQSGDIWVTGVNNWSSTGLGHWLRTGDVVTVRHAEQPEQWSSFLVRFSMVDAHAVPGGLEQDTINGLVSLAALPAGTDATDLAYLPATAREFVLGTGWSPRSNPRADGTTRPAALPTDTDWGTDTILALGGTLPTNPDPEATSTVPLLLDGMVSSTLPGHRWRDVTEPLREPTGTDPRTTLQASPGGVAWSDPLAVILVQGEVLVGHRLQNPTDPQANAFAVVGRGLLGSRVVEASLPEPTATDPWPVLGLPLGPVYQVDPGTPISAVQTNSAANWVGLQRDPDDNGRSSLVPHRRLSWVMMDVSTPGATTYHGVALVGPNQRSPAVGESPPYALQGTLAIPTWLQGLWGTAPPPTTSTAQVLVMGWMARYPSLLPSLGEEPAHHRSRYYAWAGFPARWARMQTAGTLATQVEDSPDPDLATVEFRVMAGAVNGDDRADGTLQSGSWSDWTRLATANQVTPFTNQDLDGLEIRASWRYRGAATDPAGMLRHMNTVPPTVTGVRLPVRIPLAVVAAE